MRHTSDRLRGLYNLVQRHSIATHLTELGPFLPVQARRDELPHILCSGKLQVCRAVSRYRRGALVDVPDEVDRLEVPEPRRADCEIVHEHAVLKNGVFEPALAHRLGDDPLGAVRLDGVVGDGAHGPLARREARRASLNGRVEQRELAVRVTDGQRGDDGVHACERGDDRGGLCIVDRDDLRSESLELGVARRAGKDENVVFLGLEDTFNYVATEASCSSCDSDFDHG